MYKKNLILGGVLIILIAIAYIYQGPLKKWQDKLGTPANLFSRLDTSKIDKLEITKDGQVQSFEKKGDKWIVSGTKEFPAKSDIISGFINDIGTAEKADMTLVSANKDKKSDYKVDVSGVGVKLSQAGAVLANFVIGKNTDDFSSTYISAANLNDTYSIAVNLHKYIDQPDWRDDSIFATAKSKLVKIRFQYPTNTFTVEKKNDKWSGTDPHTFSVAQDKVDNIAGLMSNLTAADIPAQTFNGTGLEKHLIIVEASGNGVDNTIMVGTDDGKGSYYAKRGDSDNIYLITKKDRDALDKTITQLK